MRQSQLVAGIMLAAGVALGAIPFHSTFPTVTRAASSAEEKRDRWEYAELASVRREGKTIKEFRVTWEGPDDPRHSAATYAELAEKLGLKVTRTDSTALLNALGKEGWELVSYATTEVFRSDTQLLQSRYVWMLKRRK